MLATFYVACANDPITNRDNGTAGTGGSDVADAGETGDAGADATSGSGGTSGGSAGHGGTANGGKGGNIDSPGGEGGMSAAGETGEAGASGGGPIDSCGGVTVGVKSKFPVPLTTGVAKPAGTAGGLSVINWAGFKGAVSFTFDDNLQSQVTHYAELNAVGVPMTFYLVGSTFSNSTATWISAFADGHELGNHTMHHCKVDGTQCGWGGFTTIDEEIDADTAKMKLLIGVPDVYTFASPNGDNGWAAPAGQRFALNRGVYDNPTGVMPNDTTNAYNLPCHIANMDEKAVGGFNTITDDVRTRGAWRIILAHNVDPAIVDYGYNPVQLAEIVGAMTYAKNLQDVWVDKMVSIGAYWRAQKALTDAVVTTSGASKTYTWTLPDHFPPGQFLRVKVDGGTLKQCDTELTWDEHGYYEIALDAGSVTIAP